MKSRTLYLIGLFLVLQGCAVPVPEIQFPDIQIPGFLDIIDIISPQPTEVVTTEPVPERTPEATADAGDAVPKPTAPFTATVAPAVPPTAVFTPEAVRPAPSPTASTIMFRLQHGAPAYAPNIFHQEAGCNWLGVGGQVLGEDGAPLQNLVVELGGSLAGEEISMLSLTGTAPVYGDGGYEFTLADRPATSDRTLWLQVHDLENTPLSEKVYFSTYDDCNLNMIVITFVLTPEAEVYIPLIMK